MMHWNEGFYGFNMGHPLGWGMMIIFWIFIFMVIVYLAKNLRGSSRMGDETALDIIKKRYARGEISREEFEAYKHDLES